MNLRNRLAQLEKIHNPTPPAKVFVYFHDQEKGYAEKSTGPYYPTFDELAAVLGWKPSEHDALLAVKYASQTRVFIPDNGRE
jgi:hypothetical protein